jgi:hypothetical protein
MTAFSFTSPLAGEVDRVAVGRGVGLGSILEPPSLSLPRKGGGESKRPLPSSNFDWCGNG